MEDDYSNRAGLLPKGCKDLIDVTKKKFAGHFSICVRLPKVRNKDIEITIKDRHLTLVARPANGQAPLETNFDVPDDFSLTKTRAFHVHDRLLIIIPRFKAG
jgi:HSP20 family molecular chaperone IbpA